MIKQYKDELYNPYLEKFLSIEHFTNIEKYREMIYDKAVKQGHSIEEYHDNITGYQIRESLRDKYAFAIPNKEAINVVCKYTPIIEIGAGKGYWAALIRNNMLTPEDEYNDSGYLGSKHIKCYDYIENSVHVARKEIGYYYPVKILDKDYKSEIKRIFAADQHESNLFLCWPPQDDEMAYNYINLFKGEYVIYVGEARGGCTANELFFDLLRDKFTFVRSCNIPQFPTIHDSLTVFRRKNE